MSRQVMQVVVLVDVESGDMLGVQNFPKQEAFAVGILELAKIHVREFFAKMRADAQGVEEVQAGAIDLTKLNGRGDKLRKAA